MTRLLVLALFSSASVATFAGALGLATWSSGCSDAALASGSGSADAGTLRRDASPVNPSDAGPAPDAGTGATANCEKYCGLVTTNCIEDNAQYSSASECEALCPHLPVGGPLGEDTEKDTATLACRQYWADAPARTSPERYCLAAGPFGGNTCGDRCTAFCDVLLSVCSGDAGAATYESRDACRTNCKFFAYRDAGDDGGGESPLGPTKGDSFNCRLYWLRAASMDTQQCAALAPNSDTCSD